MTTNSLYNLVPAVALTHSDADTRVEWVVSQTFEIFGDPGKKQFDDENDADNYVQELAEGIADSFYTRDGDFAVCPYVETIGSHLGSSNEVDWVDNLAWEFLDDDDDEDAENPDDYALMRMPWDDLVSACEEAIEKKRHVFVCGEEIEDADEQEIALSLIHAIDNPAPAPLDRIDNPNAREAAYAGLPAVRYRKDGSAILVNLWPVTSFKHGEEMYRLFWSAGLKYPFPYRIKEDRRREIESCIRNIQAVHTMNYVNKIDALRREIRNKQMELLDLERQAEADLHSMDEELHRAEHRFDNFPPA